MQYSQTYDESEVVRRFLRILEALGPHADDFVLGYKNASDVDLRETLARSRGMRHGKIDRLGLSSGKGMAAILCLAIVVGIQFGLIFAGVCFWAGLALSIRAHYRMGRFRLDRSHLTHAAGHFELLEPCLRGKEGSAKDIVAEHVDSMAMMHECGVLTLSSFGKLVDTASYLKFVSPCIRDHMERAKAKIRNDEVRFGIPRRTQLP